MTSRSDIRKILRQQRQALTHQVQQRHAARVANHLVHSHLFRPAQHIACYLANDGEVDLRPVMQRIWSMGKQCYLPILSEGEQQHMWFAPYAPTDILKANRYGIAEPDCHPDAWLEPHQLDLVLMPLVGFDAQGNPIDREVDDFHARVVQHECDHLDGILYPQRMTDMRLFGFTDVLS